MYANAPKWTGRVPNRALAAVFAIAALLPFCGAASGRTVSVQSAATVHKLVSATVQPLMARHRIPGMAVGIVDADHHYVFDYGVASRDTGRPVTKATLFEIGSMTKTLTATLVSYARAGGHLSLSDKVAQHLPSLRGSAFGSLTLLELGTYTPGGVPLQVPDDIHNETQLLAYLTSWRPTYPPGTHRTYSNLSIGVLGMIAARSMGQPFDALMQETLLPELGMKHTYLHVPFAEQPDYAQGYTEEGAPIRLDPGELGQEAYGLKSTAGDLVRFIAANMNLIQLKTQLQRAILHTHTGYFTSGAMTQDLVWEQVPCPTTLNSVLAANSEAIVYGAVPVTRMTPPRTPQQAVWINKTGSTNGFAAYMAFIPGQQVGVVMLANKNFPTTDRVAAAYTLLMAIIHGRAR